MTDEVVELARRARGGDRQALEPLVRATYPDAYGLALRLLGDEHDARDAVQEAFARALRGIRRFRGDAAFTTWLHRITANCAADVLARRARTAHQDLDTLAPEHQRALTDTRVEHDPERRSFQRADRDRLVAALQALPARLRAVVVLRDVYDMSHEAIAAELGITVAAAKVRLHRGRRRLREDLYAVAEPSGARVEVSGGTCPDASGGARPAAGGAAGPGASKAARSAAGGAAGPALSGPARSGASRPAAAGRARLGAAGLEPGSSATAGGLVPWVRSERAG